MPRQEPYSKSELRRLKRKRLEKIAGELAIEDPGRFRNKGQLIEAILEAQEWDDPLRRITNPRKKAMLSVLRRVGVVSKAAALVGISRRRHYHWVKHDPDYAELVEDAKAEAGDDVLFHALKLAREGVREPFVHGGQVVKDESGKVMYRTRYPERLIIRLLEALIPEDFARHHYLHHKVDVEDQIRALAEKLGIDPDDALATAREVMESRRGVRPS